jgi:hypothetical protein
VVKRLFILALALIAISLLFVPVAGAAGNGGQGTGKSRVVAALGIATVQGQDAIVEVIVVVPPGQGIREAVREALGKQGARPFESAGLGSEGFTITGLVWGSLPVVQNYNPSGEPTTVAGLTALTSTHTTWDGVATSNFDIDFGVITNRCPSLVRECKGPQLYDGNNDVGWLRLGPRTLGVTWFGTSTDEADMALNTRFNWANDGTSDYDVETVLLHENGHVVGLGHSDTAGAVMEPVYAGVRQALHQDDEEGTTFLYDSAITGSVSGTVTDGTEPIGGATVVLEGTSLQTTTVADGTYTILGVPDPVTYDVTASADGFQSATTRLTVSGAAAADFTLTASSGDDNGGGPPPCKGKNKNDPGC